MKIHTGIITPKITETQEFFEKNFGFRTKFASEWFILLHADGNPENEIAFMLPDMPQVKLPQFQRPMTSGGVWLILEVKDVAAEFRRCQALGLNLAMPLTQEAWGDTHFVVLEPNGIAVDIVQERNA